MDVLGEDHVLSANLGRYNLEGFDNDALDFAQLEDFINNDSSHINFPDESVSVLQGGAGGVYPANGRGGMDGGGGVKTALAAHHHHQQHLPPHHPQHPHPHANPGNPQQAHNAHQQMTKNLHFCHPQLPDSPPDSGSEPYSPPDGNQTENSCNMKGNIVGSMGSIPQQLYPTSQAPHAPPHSSTSSPPHLHTSSSLQGQPHSMGKQQQQQPYGSYAEPPKLNHMPSSQGPAAGPSAMPPVLHPQMLPSGEFNHMNNSVNHPNKKRKYSDSPNSTVTPGTMGPGMLGNLNNMMSIKQEPGEGCHHIIMPHGVLPDCVEDDFSYDLSSDAGTAFLDGVYQVIKWQPHNQNKWCTLLDANFKELTMPSYRVDADKGFNFSVPDEAFVCQKKNHFQVTVHVGMAGDPRYVKTPEGTKKIDNFQLHFYGVKMESPTQFIKVEQSQSDRSKKAFHPVKVDIPPDQVTKVTVGRMHFSETTSNNMRKKGKPNPDQRYFMLVVALMAHSTNHEAMISAQVSERIIVRASNPGQFDSDVDVLWQKGHTPESVYHGGRVGINTDRPDEALTVHGNMKLTGHIIQPSDKRVKKDIQEIDSRDQLKNVAQMKVYKYAYNDAFAESCGMSEDELYDTGILAQELLEVLPDAVKESGDLDLGDGETVENFLVVNKDRIYMENVGAVKELCKLTDNLENRIDELEKMNKRLSKLKRFDSLKSTASIRSLSTCSTISRATSSIPPSKKSESTTMTSVSSNGSQKPKDSSQRDHKHHHHHHRCGYSGSSGSIENAKSLDEYGVCSNRFIQVTVVILVLVMAFCLVSITTLYIMEKHKAGQSVWLTPASDTTTTQVATTTTTTRATTAPDVTNSDISSKLNPTTISPPGAGAHSPVQPTSERGPSGAAGPPGAPGVPQSPGQPAGDSVPSGPAGPVNSPESLPRHPGGGMDRGEIQDESFDAVNGSRSAAEFHPNMSNTTDNVTSIPELPMSLPQAELTMLIPPRCLREACMTYCCPPATPLNDPSAGSKPRKPASDGHNNVDNNKTFNYVVPIEDLVISRSDDHQSRDSGYHQYGSSSEDNKDDYFPGSLEPTVYYQVDNPPVELHVSDKEEQNRRRRRSVDPETAPMERLDLKATMRILENNQSIGSSLCQDEACQSGLGGNYSYAVQISQHFPISTITIEFSTANGLSTSFCHHSWESQCDIYETEDANFHYRITPAGDQDWNLPVGYYYTSYFVFRVAYETTENVCDLPAQEVGHSYASYNLHFNRVCSEEIYD